MSFNNRGTSVFAGFLGEETQVKQKLFDFVVQLMASIGARVRRKNARKLNLSEQCCKHESICGQRWKTAQRAKGL